MITNVRVMSAEELTDFAPRRVFADGVEIEQCWYVDTDLMLLKTYDVIGDGKCHLLNDPAVTGTTGLEILDGKLFSRTIQAKVIEIVPVKGSRERAGL